MMIARTEVYSMADVHRLEPTTRTPGAETVFAAWERFVQGDDHIHGVRPEVAISWHRCREKYRVDPHLAEAPVAVAQSDRTAEHDVVFTELGGLAATLSHEVARNSGIVTVTDATGRILAAWGNQATLSRAADANLAPWSCWSEAGAGTNGMGTALETRGPVVIRGPEHWCKAFHDWVCAGIAVRDVVTMQPIAVLNISCWRAQLPESTGGWLTGTVATTQRTLKRRARESAAALATAFTRAASGSGAALAAIDTAGNVVVADDRAGMHLGVPAHAPAIDPAMRWDSALPDLIGIARYASRHATQDPEWVGSTEIFTHRSEEPTPVTIRPVFLAGRLAGHLVRFGISGELPLLRTDDRQGPARTAADPRPRRLTALRGTRMVLLRLTEVRLAESEGNDVWLSTDQGRLKAASPGLDKLDGELSDAGFLRVHRRYVVNLSRIREIDRGPKGELSLVIDGSPGEVVPVSRRNAPQVRRALGI